MVVKKEKAILNLEKQKSYSNEGVNRPKTGKFDEVNLQPLLTDRRQFFNRSNKHISHGNVHLSAVPVCLYNSNAYTT